MRCQLSGGTVQKWLVTRLHAVEAAGVSTVGLHPGVVTLAILAVALVGRAHGSRGRVNQGSTGRLGRIRRRRVGLAASLFAVEGHPCVVLLVKLAVAAVGSAQLCVAVRFGAATG